MNEQDRTLGGVQDQLAGWRDPPGMGRILAISCAVGVGTSLVLITVGMLAAGQVWQSSLALGTFIAMWGGLGFGSMIGGVVYLTKLESTAKGPEVEQARASRGVAPPPLTAPSPPPAEADAGQRSADAA